MTWGKAQYIQLYEFSRSQNNSSYFVKKKFVYISGRVYNKIFTVLSEEITSYFSQKLHNAFVILKKLLKFRLFEVL